MTLKKKNVQHRTWYLLINKPTNYRSFLWLGDESGNFCDFKMHRLKQIKNSVLFNYQYILRGISNYDIRFIFIITKWFVNSRCQLWRQQDHPIWPFVLSLTFSVLTDSIVQRGITAYKWMRYYYSTQLY